MSLEGEKGHPPLPPPAPGFLERAFEVWGHCGVETPQILHGALTEIISTGRAGMELVSLMHWACCLHLMLVSRPVQINYNLEAQESGHCMPLVAPAVRGDVTARPVAYTGPHTIFRISFREDQVRLLLLDRGLHCPGRETFPSCSSESPNLNSPQFLFSVLFFIFAKYL